MLVLVTWSIFYKRTLNRFVAFCVLSGMLFAFNQLNYLFLHTTLWNVLFTEFFVLSRLSIANDILYYRLLRILWNVLQYYCNLKFWILLARIEMLWAANFSLNTYLKDFEIGTFSQNIMVLCIVLSFSARPIDQGPLFFPDELKFTPLIDSNWKWFQKQLKNSVSIKINSDRGFQRENSTSSLFENNTVQIQHHPSVTDWWLVPVVSSKHKTITTIRSLD